MTASELQSESPFDRGRVPCPQGGEDRWSARWLMEQMGYDNWQNFEKVRGGRINIRAGYAELV